MYSPNNPSEANRVVDTSPSLPPQRCLQLLLGDPEASLSQIRCIIPPPCSGVYHRVSYRLDVPKNLPMGGSQEASRTGSFLLSELPPDV